MSLLALLLMLLLSPMRMLLLMLLTFFHMVLHGSILTCFLVRLVSILCMLVSFVV